MKKRLKPRVRLLLWCLLMECFGHFRASVEENNPSFLLDLFTCDKCKRIIAKLGAIEPEWWTE